MAPRRAGHRSLVGASVAACSVGMCAFSVMPGMSRMVERRGPARGASTASDTQTSQPALAAGLAVAALGAAAAAVAASRSAVARAAVTTKDAKGRFRFSARSADAGAATLSPAKESGYQLPFTAQWEGEIGATLPLCDPKDGITRWDPLNLSSGANAAKFDDFRAAEIKHGRVAMIASAGLMVQHSWRLPYILTGDAILSLEDAPSGFAAASTFPSSLGFALIFLTAGFFEMGILSDKGRSPGDFGDPLALRKEIAHTSIDDARLKTYEIEHGRLAMLGVMGSFAAEYVTGFDAVDQWNHAMEGAARLIHYTTFH